MTRKSVYLIGVAGGSGSGKTTICRFLADALEESVILSCDDYYHSQETLSAKERETTNYDHPSAIDFGLLHSHLQLLRQGDSVEVPRYCFASHTRKSETQRLEATRAIFVEGILLFAEPNVRELFDLRIFVDADSNVRFDRRLYRDVEERGRTPKSVRLQWQETVEPMYRQHVAPTRSIAEITVSTTRENDTAMAVLAAGIRSWIV